MSSWVRLWTDMPSDPKWRLIAADADRSVSEVIAVFNFMMVCAGTNDANVTNVRERDVQRGVLKNWDDRVCAAGLNLCVQNVTDIRCAMQGIVLEGDLLMGWDKRQPLREDSSGAERARAWRERQRTLRNVTRTYVPERNAPDTDTDTDTEKKKESSLRSESSVSEKPIGSRKRKTPNSRIDYPPDFERFWRGYPTDSNMSKAEALPEWEKLDAADREAAERSLAGFRAYCSKNPDYRPLHANRYLKRRRFDGHLATNGHTGSAPARSKKEGILSWWIDDQGMSRKDAEERWERMPELHD